MGVLCMCLFVFLLLPLKFSLTFAILIMICLGVGLFGTPCLGLSVLPVPGSLFPLSTSGSFQP